MLSFHNKKSIKTKYLNRVRAHVKADEIIKGQYWENGKGCAVGCTIHSSNHHSYEKELGIPRWLAIIEDRIFEGLPNKRAKKWPLKFLEAIPIGIDLEQIKKPFLLFILNSVLDKFNYKKFPDVKKSIIEVIRLYEINETDLNKFKIAASAAEAACASAAYAAAAGTAAISDAVGAYAYVANAADADAIIAADAAYAIATAAYAADAADVAAYAAATATNAANAANIDTIIIEAAYIPYSAAITGADAIAGAIYTAAGADAVAETAYAAAISAATRTAAITGAVYATATADIAAADFVSSAYISYSAAYAKFADKLLELFKSCKKSSLKQTKRSKNK